MPVQPLFSKQAAYLIVLIYLRHVVAAAAAAVKFNPTHRKVIPERTLSIFSATQMNIGLLFSGTIALVLGLLFEVLIRVSKSKIWWRTRLFIVLGIFLIVASNF
jgi:hypothetical protein